MWVHDIFRLAKAPLTFFAMRIDHMVGHVLLEAEAALIVTLWAGPDMIKSRHQQSPLPLSPPVSLQPPVCGR
ncbi:hypothetical protein AGR5A_pb0065 [Agrobacterium genomosp. 5 str. CFBP 6626]|jgi:hypothetical protein|nr:hypothetical protein AGR5A_pb0065 [Agrobacterium genomosp. 5 str. CFBP 6626]